MSRLEINTEWKSSVHIAIAYKCFVHVTDTQTQKVKALLFCDA